MGSEDSSLDVRCKCLYCLNCLNLIFNSFPLDPKLRKVSLVRECCCIPGVMGKTTTKWLVMHIIYIFVIFYSSDESMEVWRDGHRHRVSRHWAICILKQDTDIWLFVPFCTPPVAPPGKQHRLLWWIHGRHPYGQGDIGQHNRNSLHRIFINIHW